MSMCFTAIVVSNGRHVIEPLRVDLSYAIPGRCMLHAKYTECSQVASSDTIGSHSREPKAQDRTDAPSIAPSEKHKSL